MGQRKGSEDSKAGPMSISLDSEMKKWIDHYQREMGFSSTSGAIKRCIVIARNVIENGSPEEVTKFVIGRDLKSKDKQ